jgi:hypothetical protein
MRNVSEKRSDKIQNTHFIFRNFSENVVEYGEAGQAMYDNTTRRMLIPRCITMATNTHSEYVILLAFAQQQWLYDRVSKLCCTCIDCLGHRLSHAN